MSSSWTQSQTSPEYLLSWANHQISALEASLEHIAHTKAQLRDHAHEVKNQIHCAISRQLETLRNREVWLLGQVEVIRQAKDDLLFKQQEDISQSLGALRNALDCLESTMNSEDSNVEQVLVETLEKLKTLSLHPCEAPHITFKVNNPALKSAIFKFGKVDSKGLPSEVAFADPQRPSSSLPRCFEEYGDAEHHVLYKTLESVKREKSSDPSIEVKIPRLLGDWLYKPSASYPSPNEPAAQSDSCGATSTPLASWLQRSKSSKLPKLNDASIQQWLLHIQEGEMEDDFEFVSANKTRTSSESESIEVVPMSIEVTDTKPSFSYFKTVQSSPLTAWLLQSQSNVHVNENDAGPVNSLASQLDYFRGVSDRIEDWLPKTANDAGNVEMTDQKNLVNRSADFCYTQCACQPDQLEIEDLEGISCAPKLKGPSKSDLTIWLKRERRPEDDVDPPSLAKVCRANEPCSTVGECCCEPNCIERSAGTSSWLSRDKNSPGKQDSPMLKCTSGFLDTSQKIQKSPMCDWLPASCTDVESKEDLEKSEVDPVVKSMMSMSLNVNHRPHQESKKMELDEGSTSSAHINAEDSNLDQWLIKKRVSAAGNADEKNAYYSAWLHRPTAGDNKWDVEKIFSAIENKEWLKKENDVSDASFDKGSVIKSDLSEWVINSNDTAI